MAAPSATSAMHIGIDILGVTRDDETGSVMLQTGNARTKEVEADRVELWQQAGLISMPAVPTGKQAACQGVIVKQGNYDVCVATRDQRGQELAGQLKPGESCFYSGGADGKAQARMVAKADGSMAIITTDDNTATGQTVYAQWKTDGRTYVSPWGSESFDLLGYHLRTKGGARFDMGPILGLPAPFDKLGTYATLKAQILNLEGATVALGNPLLPHDQLAKVIPLLAYVASLQSAVVAMQATLLALMTVPLNSAAAATPNTAAAALVTASTTLATALPGALPTMSTTAA